jgi:hypothetical protein
MRGPWSAAVEEEADDRSAGLFGPHAACSGDADGCFQEAAEDLYQDLGWQVGAERAVGDAATEQPVYRLREDLLGLIGIGVTLIQPGAVRTRFLANSELHQPGDNGNSPYAVYKENVAKMAARAHRDGAPGVLEAGDVAAVILKAVTSPRPKARYKAGSQARLAPVARRLLGDRGWDAFMRRMVPFPASGMTGAYPVPLDLR